MHKQTKKQKTNKQTKMYKINEIHWFVVEYIFGKYGTFRTHIHIK
jgi:hypothetical protein